jgi:RNA polymerase primary sigma factor
MDLSKYYSEICEHPILSKEEEAALLDIFFDEDAPSIDRARAKSQLIASNLRFVFKQAKKLSNGDIEQFIELISAGNEGLLVGLDKFDNSTGMRFLTYAGWWVYQRQMKAMSEFRLVALPTQKQQLSVKIRKFKEELGREPTMAQLQAEFPDASKKDLNELSQTAFLTFYLDCVNEDDIPVIDGMGQADYEILLDRMYDVVDTFGDEAEIIKDLYGLTDDGKKKSYAQIIDEKPELTRQYLKDLKDRAFEVLQDELV